MRTKNHSGIWCLKSRVSAKWFIGFTLVLGSACSGQNRSDSDSTIKQTATQQDTVLEDKLSEGQKNATSTNTQTSCKPTKDEIVAFAKEKGLLSGSVNVASVAIKDLSDYKGAEQSCVYFANGSSYVCTANGDLFVDSTLPNSEFGPHIRNLIPSGPPHNPLEGAGIGAVVGGFLGGAVVVGAAVGALIGDHNLAQQKIADLRAQNANQAADLLQLKVALSNEEAQHKTDQNNAATSNNCLKANGNAFNYVITHVDAAHQTFLSCLENAADNDGSNACLSAYDNNVQAQINVGKAIGGC